MRVPSSLAPVLTYARMPAPPPAAVGCAISMCHGNSTAAPFDVNDASRGIRKELFANSDSMLEMIERARFRTAAVDSRRAASGRRVADAISSARDLAAFYLRVTPPSIDAAFGCILFVLLDALFKQLTLFAMPSPEADAATARILALSAFASIQQFAGLPPSLWLRWSEDKSRVSSNPLFNAGSPLAGVTFAFMFAVPCAVLAQVAGIEWLPPPAPFPDALSTLLKTVVAPVTEECFFRAWLLTAIERAGGSPFTALIASSGLFSLYKVPISDVIANGSPSLLLYEALGAYLAYLYQQSGGSLPFVIVTHATFKLTVLALCAAQWDSVLPFQ